MVNSRLLHSVGLQRRLIAAAAASSLGMAAHAQTVLYDNGPLQTSPNGGCAGSAVSAMQNIFPINASAFGFNNNLASFVRVADDFTVQADAVVTSLTFFGYQTNSGTVSTFTGLYLQIWNGRPGDPGSSVIFGDMATNRLSSTSFTGMYRASVTVPLACNRPIMQIVVDLAGVPLPAGTYWLDWAATGDLSSGPFVPPVTVPGAWYSGNARTFAPPTGGGANIWADLIDVSANQQAALPFILRGQINECALPLPHCPADVNHDLVVNFDDILVVITTWGQNGLPNGPRPPGDVAPPPIGDCTVNFDDILGVIMAWGACPPPSGACCVPMQGCVADLTAQQCAAMNGAYHGDGSTCAQAGCPSPPPNNQCANATVVGDGSHAWDNSNATNDGPTGTPGSCEANFSRDIWFNYTATCSGTVVIDTLGSTVNTDTVLAVYSTHTCPPGALLACNDDIAFPTNLLSSVSVPVAPGQQLKIRVGSWQSSGPAGAGVLNIACYDNDVCLGAQLIAIGTSASGTLATATSDNAPTCNGVATGVGRWYRVVGNGQTLTASTCSSPANFDSRLSVYCGAGCGQLVCVAGSNANTCNQHESVSWCTLAGQTYWILVHAPTIPVPPAGPFTLAITSNGSPCGNPIACGTGAANDLCANAINVTANINGAAVSGDNSNATPPFDGGGDPQLPPGSPSCHWQSMPSNVHNTVWYRFSAPAGGAISIHTCNSTGDFTDSILGLYSGQCGSLVEIGCGEDECPSPGAAPFYSRINATGLTPGTTYYVMVGNSGGWAGSVPGPFQLVLTTNVPPPPPECSPCVGTPENTACSINGNDPAMDPNGGCNSTPPAFGVISLGQTICGISSTYITGGRLFRDTDWYLFTPSTTGTYTITVCARFAASFGFVTNGTNDLTTCTAGGAVVFVGGDATTQPGVPLALTRTLQAGRQYAVFIGPGAGINVGCPPPGQTNYTVALTSP